MPILETHATLFRNAVDDRRIPDEWFTRMPEIESGK